MWIYLALSIAVLAVSTSAPLVHAAAPAPALTVAALRIALAALILVCVAGSGLKECRHLSRRTWLLVFLSGALLAAHFAVWISSLYYTSTAASVAIVATQPVFAAILGRAFLGDAILLREALGILIAATGCVLLAGGDFAQSDAFFGDVLAVIGAVTAAAYLVVGRGLRTALPLAPYLALVNVIAALVLLLAVVIAGAPVAGFEVGSYVAIAACAVIPSLVGHTLFNWSVRRVAAHTVALFILGEPVGASLIQWGVHGEQPPWHAVVGGTIIIFGVAVGFARRSRR